MKKTISLTLICILSLPTLFGLNHFIFEDHVVCHDQEIHFHQLEIGCSTCDFIRTSFDYNYNDFEYLDTKHSFFHQNITVQTDIITSHYFNYFYLRGPPSNYSLS